MDNKEYPGLPLQKEIIQTASEFPEYEIAHKGQLEVQSIEHQRRSRLNYLFSGGANFVKQQAIPMLEEKDKEIERLNKLIDSYKFVCELADVPRVLIDNPILAKPGKLTESDIKWAKEKISEYEQSKNK